MSVSVDKDFVRFGSKSYAINKINSVEVRERRPHGRGTAIALGLIGAFFVLSGLGSFASPDGASAGSFVLGVVFIGFAYWQWQRSKLREYQLFLMTSSSEAQAFATSDHDEVINLRDQIENAMLHHSRGFRDS